MPLVHICIPCAYTMCMYIYNVCIHIQCVYTYTNVCIHIRCVLHAQRMYTCSGVSTVYMVCMYWRLSLQFYSYGNMRTCVLLQELLTVISKAPYILNEDLDVLSEKVRV